MSSEGIFVAPFYGDIRASRPSYPFLPYLYKPVPFFTRSRFSHDRSTLLLDKSDVRLSAGFLASLPTISIRQVAKGPDSAGVVQLARELGGVTVRGNHEFEVIFWLILGMHSR